MAVIGSFTGPGPHCAVGTPPAPGRLYPPAAPSLPFPAVLGGRFRTVAVPFRSWWRRAGCAAARLITAAPGTPAGGGRGGGARALGIPPPPRGRGTFGIVP